MPKRLRGILTKSLYFARIKPIVEKDKSTFNKGIVTFSADFEMAWAFRFSKSRCEHAEGIGDLERENIPILIGLFEKFQIPITWATVGHLFLSDCKRDAGTGYSHPDMPRPQYFENRNWKFDNGDWYQHDPCSNVKEASAWYANDLIDKILMSSVGHEIGCHTFSHIDFSDKNCPLELAEAEIDACVALALKKGIKLQSMVFPGGTLGNFEVFAKRNFKCYRKPMKFHLGMPVIDEFGLVAIPSSLALDKDQYGWSPEFHLMILRNFIEKAAKYKLVCHFWFHPSLDKWYLENVFPGVLQMVSEARERQEIEVCTMAQLSDKILSTLP